jgi:hypothetical protein
VGLTPREAAVQQVLDAMTADTRPPTRDEEASLGALSPPALEAALWAFARDRGAGALPALTALAGRSDRAVRRAARRTLYRLAQRGIAAPEPAAPARPIVSAAAERPVRAWLSGIDGTGARAAWVVFEGRFGALRLCSVIFSDTDGIAEVAGGEISKKRLDRELASLRASQKLPWLESDPARVAGLVAEALAVHAARGTSPPPEFDRWRPLFEQAVPPAPPPLPAEADAGHLERSPELLELADFHGWFLDPARVQSDALDLLQARESRLVVTDQIRAEREEAIVTRVAEREMLPEERRRWSRRLAEMALVLDATERPEAAEQARAAAAALADDSRDAGRHPLVRALARRALEVGAEVALGRVKLSDVSRTGDEPPAASPAAEAPRIVTG